MGKGVSEFVSWEVRLFVEMKTFKICSGSMNEIE